MSQVTVSRITCLHPDQATTQLNGVLYCRPCFQRAWQVELHLGHADEPAAVPTLPPAETCPCCGQATYEGRLHDSRRGAF